MHKTRQIKLKLVRFPLSWDKNKKRLLNQWFRHVESCPKPLARVSCAFPYGPVAQRLAQRTHNPLVVSSNLTRPTILMVIKSTGYLHRSSFWYTSLAAFLSLDYTQTTKIIGSPLTDTSSRTITAKVCFKFFNSRLRHSRLKPHPTPK